MWGVVGDEKDFFLLYKVDSFGGSCGGEVQSCRYNCFGESREWEGLLFLYKVDEFKTLFFFMKEFPYCQ